MDIETLTARQEQAIARIRAATLKLSDAIDGKVSSVTGKGLSTNDFTEEYMEKIRFLYAVYPIDNADQFMRIELE